MDQRERLAALLGGDGRRIWQGDGECAYRPLQPYRRLLARLALLAGPRFAPRHIRETWLPDQGGTIWLRAAIGGRWRSFWIPRPNDYLDLRLIRPLNRLLPDDAYQFCVLAEGGDTLLAFVSADERRRIDESLDRPRPRLGFDEHAAFFMATAETRLARADYAGLAADASALLDEAPSAPVYAARGRAAYQSGRRDDAWVDWALAAACGWGGIYAQVAAWYGPEA
ncbi:MAG TPA: hypothetical protein VGE07_14585 [Herpetosiphonaceae bacterium]